MSSKKVFQTLVLSFVFLCAIFCKLTKAKSVYVITDHGYRIYYPYNAPAKISSYGIDADHINLQKTLTLDPNYYPTGQYHGPVGMAIDPESGYIFVTHESVEGYGGLEGIQLINAKTMVDQGVIEIPGAPDLAGIAFDNERQKVYTVERGTNKLFVLLWDAVTKTLILEGGQPKILSEIGNYACGLALDEIDDILYVTSLHPHSTPVSNVVHYYDANDPNWTHKGSIEIVVDSNDRYTIGIAVYNDGLGTKYLYTGAYGSHTYLVRTDISDINNPSTEKDIGASVIDVAVDNDTGLVYITTNNDHIEAYNPAAWPSDPCCIEDANINGPAGICVPTADVSYKPPVFYLEKVDVNEPNCVFPGDYITYRITYGPNGLDHNNVVITDYLPCQVDYVNPFDPNYDPNRHTYTWQIGSLSASAPNDFVTLTVCVNLGVEPNGIITNYCEIESDNYRSYAYAYTSVCFWSPDIIYVDVNAFGCNSGLSWEHADPDLQIALQKAQAWDVNQIWVARGTYKPKTTSNRSISFELLDDVVIYGGFAGTESHINQRDLTAPNNETILSGDIGTPVDQNDNSYHVVKSVDVNNAVLDGFTITAGNANGSDANLYGGGMYCQDSNDLMVTNCTFSDNWAMVGGGMYNLFESSLTLVNCTFKDNAVHYLYYPYFSYGGGICNCQSSPNLINCAFSGNSATSTGGDTYGGAICNLNDSDPNISNCIFSGNLATTDEDSYGGAICNWVDSDPNITNCTFSDNFAREGGAVYNYDHSDPHISNCVFNGNTAISYGGSMVNSYTSLPTIINCIFSGNSATTVGNSHGGAICNWNLSGPNLTNCTFSNNSAYQGGAVFNNDSNPNITNCILWDNLDDEIYNDGSSNPVISYSDIKGDWTGTGNIDQDPCFYVVDAPTGSWTANASYDESTFQSTLTDDYASWTVNQLAGKFINPDTSQKLHFFIVSNDVNTINVWSDVESFVISGDFYRIYDYHLKVGSPCIDAGYPQGDYNGQKDIDGEPRVFDGDYNDSEIVDMGADEYYWSPADFNSDGLVNFFDYALIANVWLTTPNDVNYYDDVYDLIDNDCIDSSDLARFCEDWLWQTAWEKTFPFPYYQAIGRGMDKSMAEGLGFTQDLFTSVSAGQSQPELTAAEFEEIIKWLYDLWLTEDQLRKMMTEDDWLKFIEQVLELAKKQIQY